WRRTALAVVHRLLLPRPCDPIRRNPVSMSHDTQPQAFIPTNESFPLFSRPASDATFPIQVAELALLLLTIFWGSTFLVTKRLLETTSPGIFLSLRFALAA